MQKKQTGEKGTWERVLKLLNSDEFSEYYDQVQVQNLKTVQGLSIACVLFGVGSMILKLIPSINVGFAGQGDALLAGSALVFFLLCRFVFPKRHKGILACSYLFFAIFLLLFICMGTIWDREQPAVTFAVFLTVMPLFLLDRTWRVWLLIIGASVVFCLMAKTLKPPKIAQMDIMNTISFCLVSMIILVPFVRVRLSDVVSRRQLDLLSRTDSLTGLLNRRAGEELIKARIRTDQALSAIMIVDVDNFKAFNDTMGHEYGDMLLREVAQLLQDSVRSGDIVYRLGGDEFAIFLPSVGSRENAAQIGGKLTRGILSLQVDQRLKEKLGVSVGVAFYPDDGETFQQLYSGADGALYTAKAQGKRQCCQYSKAPEQA